MDLRIGVEWLFVPWVMLLYVLSYKGGLIFDDMVSVVPALQQNLFGHPKYPGVFRWRVWENVYRPVTVAWFKAVEWCWPGSFRAQRVSGSALHGLCAVVVAKIAMAAGIDRGAAQVCGFVFAVHPFAVNSVGYVASRAAMLSTFFALVGVWLCLIGWAWVAPVALVLSVASKEDGLAFTPLMAVLGSWQSAVVIGALCWWKRGILKDFAYGNHRNQEQAGDDIMRAIGLPGCLTQPAHGVTVFFATMKKLPLWMAGLGRSPYHGSGIQPPKWWEIALGTGVFGLFMASFWLNPLAFWLILLGPWLVYLLIPVPDQLAEYRNYSMISGFSLLITPVLLQMPVVAAAAVLVMMSVWTAWETLCWSDVVKMWEKAAVTATGDASRALGEIGAAHKLSGRTFQAELALIDAVRVNPSFGPAVNNLAWIFSDRGEHDRAIDSMKDVLARLPKYHMGWFDLGIMCGRAGRMDEAKAALVESWGRLGEARCANQIGLMEFQRRQFFEARMWFDRARQKEARYQYQYNYAMAVKGSGENADPEFAKLPQQIQMTSDMVHPGSLG